MRITKPQNETTPEASPANSTPPDGLVVSPEKAAEIRKLLGQTLRIRIKNDDGQEIEVEKTVEETVRDFIAAKAAWQTLTRVCECMAINFYNVAPYNQFWTEHPGLKEYVKAAQEKLKVRSSIVGLDAAIARINTQSQKTDDNVARLQNAIDKVVPLDGGLPVSLLDELDQSRT